MKSYYFLLLLLLPSFLMFTSCSKDDDQDNIQKEQPTASTDITPKAMGQVLADVADVKGVVQHVGALWSIVVSVEGTYDSQIHYYPTNLSADMKKEGQIVIFSGSTYQMDQEILSGIAQLGGNEYYVVTIRQIKAIIEK